MESLAIDSRYELASSWAAGWQLARRMGGMDGFEEALEDCPYYCPWATLAISNGQRGLAGFIRLGDELVPGGETAGEPLYHRFFRLVRQHATAERWLVKPQHLAENPMRTPAYKLREEELADQLVDTLLDKVVRGITSLPEEDSTHHLAVIGAFIDAFSDFQSPFDRGTGIQEKIAEWWGGTTTERKARAPWLVALMLDKKTSARKKKAST